MFNPTTPPLWPTLRAAVTRRAIDVLDSAFSAGERALESVHQKLGRSTLVDELLEERDEWLGEIAELKTKLAARNGCEPSPIYLRYAANDLIDAIATPTGRDFGHAWERACLMFGRFGSAPVLLNDLRARLAEAERERDEWARQCNLMSELQADTLNETAAVVADRDRLRTEKADAVAETVARGLELLEALGMKNPVSWEEMVREVKRLRFGLNEDERRELRESREELDAIHALAGQVSGEDPQDYETALAAAEMLVARTNRFEAELASARQELERMRTNAPLVQWVHRFAETYGPGGDNESEFTVPSAAWHELVALRVQSHVESLGGWQEPTEPADESLGF